MSQSGLYVFGGLLVWLVAVVVSGMLLYRIGKDYGEGRVAQAQKSANLLIALSIGCGVLEHLVYGAMPILWVAMLSLSIWGKYQMSKAKPL